MASKNQLMKQASCSTVMNSLLGKVTQISLDDVFAPRTPQDRLQRRTKIICTMGPACWDVDKLVQMIDAGMDICRFNFSHGDHTSHYKVIENIKEAQRIRAEQKKPHKSLALMLDTKGPEIRTGALKEGESSIVLKRGQDLKITTEYSTPNDSACISCTYEKLHTAVKPGNVILMADGSVSCEVTSCHDGYVMVKVLNDAQIGSHKNMNLPGVKVDLPVCGPREINDLTAFGLPNGMHYVAASFVQCGQDVRDIRNILGEKGRHFKIIPKIENQEGMINFDEILREADGIMIARGDLGMELPFEKVFLAQKMMIAKCNVAGKPVIVATQMMESMIKLPRPTRAEVSDCANAVLDGCDCVMLSGESAGGMFPINAVEVLAKTCLEAESCINYRSLYQAIHNAVPYPMAVPESVCAAAVETAQDTNSSLIIALTETGQTARLIAKFRPSQIVLAVSAADTQMCLLAVVRGVLPFKVGSFVGTESVINQALVFAKENHLIKSGDSIVCVHGEREEVSGYTNTMKVITCP